MGASGKGKEVRYTKFVYATYVALTTTEMRTIQPLLKEYGIGSACATAMRNMGIIGQKHGRCLWLAEELPTPELVHRIMDAASAVSLTANHRVKKNAEAKVEAEVVVPKEEHIEKPLPQKVVSFQPPLFAKTLKGDGEIIAAVLSFMSNMEAKSGMILASINSIKGLLEDIKKGQQEAAATASLSSHEESQQLTAAM